MGIDKALYGYKAKKLPTVKIAKKLKVGGPVEEDKPKPKPNNVITFPVPANSPLGTWWLKTSKEKKKEIASVDDVAPYLSKYFSTKELEAMSEAEMLQKLQELIDKGVI